MLLVSVLSVLSPPLMVKPQCAQCEQRQSLHLLLLLLVVGIRVEVVMS